jgi:predicted Fe-S protein YdhL (DUF1289 family)
MIDQGELFVIPNPCRGICTVNNRGYCKGCLRSRKERFHWHEFSPFHQQLIINTCEKRRLKIIAAKSAQPEDDFEEVIPQLDMFKASPDESLNSNDYKPEITETNEALKPQKARPTSPDKNIENTGISGVIDQPAEAVLSQAPEQNAISAKATKPESIAETADNLTHPSPPEKESAANKAAPQKHKPAPSSDQFDLF